jgi:hypothetical protein
MALCLCIMSSLVMEATCCAVMCTFWKILLVDVRSREGPKPTSKFVLRAPNLDGDAKRIHGGLSWFERKKALRPVGGEVLYFFAPKCLCRGYKLWKRESISGLRERESTKEIAWDVDLLRWGDDLFFLVSSPFVESPACPFIGSRGGRDTGDALEVKFCQALWKPL